ncbi:hypothetical protein HYV50_01245 [Candidatus Pacearchaeota archaeon]|nr:hypothetical protein [Candidatus Pacearchaeota archaeon]
MRINNFTQYGERANYDFHLRLTKQQKERLVALSRAAGFNHLSSYLRFMLLSPSLDEKLNRILEILKDLQEKANSPVAREN